jgi:hypothetical protein
MQSRTVVPTEINTHQVPIITMSQTILTAPLALMVNQQIHI